MRYEYVFIAEIRGLVPPREAEIVLDVPGVDGSVTYTGDRDAIPMVVDLKSVIGRQLLSGLAGKAVTDRSAELKRAVNSIRQNRKKSEYHEALVIIKVTGEVKDFELEHCREEEEFILCLGNSPAKDIQKFHKNYIQSFQAALHLAASNDISAKNLVDCVIFYRDDGKPIFCYEMEAYGTAYVASTITPGLVGDVMRYASVLNKERSHEDVIRLLSKSMDLTSDNLLSFLSAWAALEIFIGKAFKEYEGLVFGGAGEGLVPAHPEVIRRVREVMSDKFRLTDKFAIISGVLNKSGVDEDLKIFSSIKKLRDNLLHGQKVDISNLPCEATRNLTSKYLGLHLALAGKAS